MREILKQKKATLDIRPEPENTSRNVNDRAPICDIQETRFSEVITGRPVEE